MFGSESLVESVLRQLLGGEAVIAARAVAEAMRVVEWVQRHHHRTGVLLKADASPVTVADYAAQAIVSARLEAACRDIPLVAEEDASVLRSGRADPIRARVLEAVRAVEPGMDADDALETIDRGGGTPGQRYWTLDPIDGTKGLIRGAQYAVALALIQDGEVQLGVIGCPRLSFRGARVTRRSNDPDGAGLAIAARGRGAWWVVLAAKEITRLTVSAVAAPTNARVLHSFESTHSDAERLGRVLQAVATHVQPLLMDSQAKHVVLAARRADVLLRFPTTPAFHDAVWDQAAGSIIVSEAFGQVTDLAGKPLDFSTGRRLLRNIGLVATNGWLHEATLRAIEASELLTSHGQLPATDA
jgi:3'(2'), 5'-bisphosphate nucleotidase